MEFAFVSWAGSSGRRACPLATFGSRAPLSLHTRLCCAEPPRADQPELKNAAELRGAIALVVRGGCSFAHKARLLQRAGAVAMLLANNTREEPLAAFTMGESPDELEQRKIGRLEPITMPCVMMCLRDVRELFQKFPPSVKTGILDFEILPSEEGAAIADECLRLQSELHEAAEGKGWKAIKRTTTSIIKMLEPQTPTTGSTAEASAAVPSGQDGDMTPEESATEVAATRENQPPLLAFVQWATSASTYEICFAPLADFCSAQAGASYAGKLVACDPLLADQPLQNEEQLKGAVAVLRRGSCSFPEKLERVQRAGAVAAIMCNNDDEDLDAAFVMSVDHIDAANATLPAVMISHNGFLRLQSALSVSTARVLCLAGEAADGLLAASGKSVSFRSLPAPRPAPAKAGRSSDAALVDLHVACREGDRAACLRVLSTSGDDATKRALVTASCASTGLTALHHACASGNDNVVELLLQLGASPTAVDLAVQTPLHVACAYSHPECARLLLHAEGASPQVPAALYNADEAYGGLATRRNIGDATAMHEAARVGSAECIELLLACNARMSCAGNQDAESSKYTFLGVDARDAERRTPLLVACAHAHAECALYLVAANADVNATDSRGHSPLSLACEAANDAAKEAEAVQIVAKLVSVGAAMEENGRAQGNERLLVDRVEAPELHRELEVLYLRHEARRARLDSQALRRENQSASERVEGLEDEVRALRSQVDAHGGYSHQIQQLQLQMQMMLQLQTSYGQQPLAAPIQDATATPLLASSLESSAGKSDEELALDAALARDLGKKCLRQQQCVLAEKYFQRSQELMPLPGVKRLLETARRRPTRGSEATERADPGPASTASSNGLAVPANERDSTIKRLRGRIHSVDATRQARSMLQRELDKLEALSTAEEFTLACRWVEWLVALPWGDPSSGLHSVDLCTTKRNAFRQLDMLDVSRVGAQRVRAARKIQRAFRERYAVHMRTRSDAAARIQALVRGEMARRRYEATKQGLLEALEQRAAQAANQKDSKEGFRPSEVDYAATVDAAIHRKLPQRYAAKELVQGTLLDVEKRLRVVQIVQCTKTGPALSIRLEPTSTAASSFFVWTRWGSELDKLCQCSLSGPYEDRQDAQRRFERITREEASREKQSDAQKASGSEAVHESGLEFLTSFVVGRTAWGSSSSAVSA